MLRILLLAVLAALALPAVPASHAPQGACDAKGKPALGIVEVTLGFAAGTFYVDDRNALVNGVWVYQESGFGWTPRAPGAYRDDVAAHNLQRGGASFLVPDDTETCVDDPLVVPDALVL